MIHVAKSSCVSQLSPRVVTTAAETWEAAPARAHVDTITAAAMTTTVRTMSPQRWTESLLLLTVHCFHWNDTESCVFPSHSLLPSHNKQTGHRYFISCNLPHVKGLQREPAADIISYNTQIDIISNLKWLWLERVTWTNAVSPTFSKPLWRLHAWLWVLLQPLLSQLLPRQFILCVVPQH